MKHLRLFVLFAALAIVPVFTQGAMAAQWFLGISSGSIYNSYQLRTSTLDQDYITQGYTLNLWQWGVDTTPNPNWSVGFEEALGLGNKNGQQINMANVTATVRHRSSSDFTWGVMGRAYVENNHDLAPIQSRYSLLGEAGYYSLEDDGTGPFNLSIMGGLGVSCFNLAGRDPVWAPVARAEFRVAPAPVNITLATEWILGKTNQNEWLTGKFSQVSLGVQKLF